MSEAALPFPTSQCHACAHLRIVRSKTSAFLLCQALAEKYPRQPVRACPGFEAARPGTA